MLPKRFRINDPSDFQRIFTSGKATWAPGVRIISVSNDLGHNRFGFIASKKVGNSVVRHRTVRVLREAVYSSLATGSKDYIIVAQAGFAEKFNKDKLLSRL
jgi:ribonuclease P protein component